MCVHIFNGKNFSKFYFLILGPSDSASELLVQISGNNLDDFYPAVAISALMKILKDQSLSQHHVMAIQALGFIFKSLGMKSVPYLPQVSLDFR